MTVKRLQRMNERNYYIHYNNLTLKLSGCIITFTARSQYGTGSVMNLRFGLGTVGAFPVVGLESWVGPLRNGGFSISAESCRSGSAY